MYENFIKIKKFIDDNKKKEEILDLTESMKYDDRILMYISSLSSKDLCKNIINIRNFKDSLYYYFNVYPESILEVIKFIELDMDSQCNRFEDADNFADIANYILEMVPIIQSFAQLEKNYGKEGSRIIIDNCQDILFGGFAPNSESAEILSKALGNRTVLYGSISRGKNDPSQSLQMMSRTLMSPDELKSFRKDILFLPKRETVPCRHSFPCFLNGGFSLAMRMRCRNRQPEM